MPDVGLSEIAAQELDRAYRWYEEQRVGLGDELLTAFLARFVGSAKTRGSTR